MKIQNLTKKFKLTVAFLLALLCTAAVPGEASAQFNKLKDKVKKVMTTTDTTQNESNNAMDSAVQNRDAEEVIENAYVFYVSKVEGFEARFHDAGQVANEAKAYAGKLDQVLKANPQYRNRKLGTIVRNESVQMTAGELLDKLNHAGEIIAQGQSNRQAQNMSYFVQGDVDVWKRRTEKLQSNDGFVEVVSREYPLLFNRAQGEKELLAGYAKGNGGKPLPGSVIAPLHNQIEELLTEMNRLAPIFAPEKGTSAVEPFVATLVKSEVANYIPSAALLHAVWSPEQSGWLIDKNDLGVPLNRRRMGISLSRVANQKFCIEQHFFYLENYAGGGRYQRGDDVQFADVRFVKCQ